MKKVVKFDIPNLQSATDNLSKRSLENNFPQLCSYLKPNSKVLDVGCGPGTITIGVAQYLKSGEVVGIDPIEDWIDSANELARQKKLKNVVFKLGDSHNLDFPDDSFDVTYSHFVIKHLIDPVMGLKEQKRVTKKGGWVIARLGEYGITLRYPSCPAVEKVMAARARYSEYLQSRYKPGDHIRGFYADSNAGRKCVEWFTKAGLEELIVESNAKVEHPGTKNFDKTSMSRRLSMDGPFSEFYKGMFETGFLELNILQQAQKEMDAWYSEPYAFIFQGEIVAIGRA